MAQEREIATRIASLGELSEIVAAIRAIAASQMQQSLRSLEAIQRYSDTIREALLDAADMLPADGRTTAGTAPAQPGLIVFCAEHGLCGGFNEHLVQAAEQMLREASAVLIVVGSRGGQICLERGLKPRLVLPMATHSSGVTATARRLATAVYGMLSDGAVTGLEVVYVQHGAAEAVRLVRSRLLPLELPIMNRQARRVPPLINLSPRHLFDDIVIEYFFATLENAAMQSFFSENSIRFRTMEAARHNTENKSEELTKLVRRLRQDAVTTEILDLISGAQALSFE
ncbi:MAG TPA: FoF1 ATP synthase subunit gamma [Candidatus Binataceae bacterium]|nr:FoF1 ATP synthase subunit gamma [Candidatus Binataceae bacterium]